jgi:glycosyltransferase involved in cell wall biosynthesis
MLSVIIITKNEALNIRRCLESVRFADEVIVLDSGSTDETVRIAQEFTPHVYSSSDWQGYGIQKQRALDYATQSWVLNLDADECVDATLQRHILTQIQANQFDAFCIPIQLYFYHKIRRYSSSPTRHVRLFKRAGALFSLDIVHEKIILPPTARVGKLTAPLLHYSYRDISHALDKLNRYSSYSARISREANKKFSLWAALGSSTWMFWRCYVLQGGFLDGRVGFLLALINAQASFYRKVKRGYPDLIEE